MGVASVEQIGSRDQPVSGPPSGINTVFDRLKPAGLVESKYRACEVSGS